MEKNQTLTMHQNFVVESNSITSTEADMIDKKTWWFYKQK